MLLMKKTHTVKVTQDLYDEYKKSANRIGRSVSEMTREMIKAFVAGDLRINRSVHEHEKILTHDRELYRIE